MYTCIYTNTYIHIHTIYTHASPGGVPGISAFTYICKYMSVRVYIYIYT